MSISLINTLNGFANDNANYKEDVLSNHADMKKESKTLGFAIKMLKQVSAETGYALTPSHAKILNAAKKDEELYKFIAENVRTTASGGYNAFYLRQLLHKITSGALEVSEGTVKIAKTKKKAKVQKAEVTESAPMLQLKEKAAKKVEVAEEVAA